MPAFPVALTILPSYTCTAVCQDCCFQCSPQVRGRIPQERILRYIHECRQIPSIRLVIFSGGECFLIGDDLIQAVEEATRLGLRTRCVTNGYWATSQRAAHLRLSPLVQAGLKELNFSTGDQHQAWIPVERVITGATEAIRQGLNVAIAVEGRAEDQYNATDLAQNPFLAEILQDPERCSRLHLLQSPWISPDLIPAKNVASPDGDNGRLNPVGGGCTSILTTLVISPSESLAACCGLTHEQIPEMRLGSLREERLIDLVEKGRQDFMKMWLMVEGPGKILAWAAEKDPQIQWQGCYVHHCDACRAIYTDPKVRCVIQDHYQEKLPDIIFRFTLFNHAKVKEV